MSASTAGQPLVGRHVASSREHALSYAAVLVAGLVLPGSGLVLALVLVFTRLGSSPRHVRIGLVALGAALLVAQVIGLLAGGSGATTVVSPGSPVG